MMRKAFVVVTFLILFVVFVYYNGFRLFKVNERIEQILIAKIHDTFGEKCSIDRFSIGLGSVSLQGLNLVFTDSPYEVWIDELRLGYSLNSLWKGRIVTEKSAEEITLYNPRLTLHYNSKKQTKPDVDLSLQLSNEAEQIYRSIMQEYDFIKRVTVSDGEIIAADSATSTQVKIAQKINGWAYTDDNGQAWIRLAGHIFESDEFNMAMYGQLDLARGGLDYINVDLHGYKIGNEIPFLMPNYFEVLDGQVDGHVTITERNQPTRGFNINGKLSLREGHVQLADENLDIDDINIDAEIKNWNLEITNAVQKINGSPTRLEGRIHNLIKPEFDLTVSSQQIDLKEFLGHFQRGAALPIAGTANLNVEITDRFANPRIRASLTSQNLQIHGQDVSDFVAEFGYQDRALQFDLIEGKIGQVGFTSQGGIDFKSPDRLINLLATVHGNFADALAGFGITTTDGWGSSEVNVFGSLSNPVSTGTFQLDLNSRAGTSLDLEGSFKYSQERLVLNASSAHAGLRVQASVDSLFDEPSLSVQATNIEKALAFVDVPILSNMGDRYYLNVDLEHHREGTELFVDVFRKDNYAKIFSIDTRALGPEGPGKYAGEITLLPGTPQEAQGDFGFELTNGGFRFTELQIADWLKSSFSSADSIAVENDGKISISGLQLGLLLPLFGKDATNYTGDLYAEIDLSMENGRTNYAGNLWLINGLFDNFGPVKAKMSFTADGSQLNIINIIIEDNEGLDVACAGTYTFDSGEVDAKISGNNVKLGKVIKLITGAQNVVDGDTKFNIHLKGSGPQIPLYGNITVVNPEILKLKFSQVEFNFGDEDAPSESYVDANFVHCAQVRVTKDDAFVLNGSAKLPYRGGEQLEVDLDGDGNFLATLSDLASIFRNSESRGTLSLSLTGNYTKPNFTSTTLKIAEGAVELTAVTDKIENLEVDLKIVEDDYFLDIEQFQGKIKGQPFWISNTNNTAGLNNGSYEALRIAGDDLNLGTIIIKTPTKGVLLNIPGLMNEGEMGRYAFSGKQQNEDFFVAGPWQRPKVHGKVTVSHANLMFPFDEGVGDIDPIVMNIMNNMDWDVSVLSSKNTRYVRQFGMGVYVDMEVDRKNSQLDFTGILKDSTFAIGGKVESTRGEIEYFDLDFRIEKVGAEFDYTSFYPIVYGKAWTVVRDSTNLPNDVYLTLYTVDELNQEVSRGRWDRIRIKLSTEHPIYEETLSQIMASLGYSSNTMDDQAKKAIGYSADNLFIRPLMRPIERQLQQSLGLDVVRFSYSLAQNFLSSSFNSQRSRSSLDLLRSSRLLLGKYLTEDIYLLYSGEIKTGLDYEYQNRGYGLEHILGLEYRLNSKWLLQMEYDYNTMFDQHRDDAKIWLRHSFHFESN